MKFGIIITTIVVILFGIGLWLKSSDAVQEKNIGNLSLTEQTNQIYEELYTGQAVLLDVRTQVEYDLSHASPAELFNVEGLKDGRLPDIDKDKTIYVYCRSGNRSATASQILRDAGYQDVIDIGAFTNWIDGGGQTEQTKLPYYLDLLNELGVKPIQPLGDTNAPVTMVKYSDFQCPFCSRYSLETEPKIIKDYVNSGLVEYKFRNVAYLGDESAYAAVGGYCANEQSAFWPFHDELNKRFVALGVSAFESLALSNLASDLKLDTKAFNDCVASGKYDSVVSSETIDAQNNGYESTPSFLIGTQKVNGALPFATFKAAIDAQL
jgi:protein-disulfide isomerase/rhodanese-related sulfurtransferase